MVTYRQKTMENCLESDDDVAGSSEEEVMSDDSAVAESDSDGD